MPHRKPAPAQALHEARKKVRAQAIASAKEVIYEVDDAMRGRPMPAVLAELERRLVPLGLQSSPTVAEYARAISEGRLRRESDK
jgi:hypothetical protein